MTWALNLNNIVGREKKQKNKNVILDNLVALLYNINRKIGNYIRVVFYGEYMGTSHAFGI